MRVGPKEPVSAVVATVQSRSIYNSTDEFHLPCDRRGHLASTSYPERGRAGRAYPHGRGDPLGWFRRRRTRTSSVRLGNVSRTIADGAGGEFVPGSRGTKQA